MFLWITFPRTNQAASCFPPSPEPRHKRTLSTLQRKYLNIELTPDLTKGHSTAQEKPSGLLCFVNQDPESLYPWRPDCTYLMLLNLEVKTCGMKLGALGASQGHEGTKPRMLQRARDGMVGWVKATVTNLSESVLHIMASLCSTLPPQGI
ncbi:hypothetical protein ATANTOWER_028826 [Ataeniobius toweri]|uniref:Uncharacterized protein n=1 Tax=Ataeniobius toweri TaxID=208326 RepID=A0ABU7C0X5_9TELE|nr:hypothetical protein [Ataeniobius toweri]